MPRIITVDPTGAIFRIVRSAMDLLDLSVTQVDVPTGAEALEELGRPADMIVSAFELDEDMRGIELALRVRQSSPDTAFLLLGDLDGPESFDDEETSGTPPFGYIRRPVDAKLLKVLLAGLDGHEAMINALNDTETAAAQSSTNNAPIPAIDPKAAQPIVDNLMQELGALSIIMANRAGEMIVERGTMNEMERDGLTHALASAVTTNINVKEIVGGQVSSVQLYDGDEYDIFVLSVGLHHFLCVVFDGQSGSKQFGMVNRYGRYAVEDLIAVIGAEAFFIRPVEQQRPEPARRSQAARPAEAEEPVVLERAHISEEQQEPEPVIEQLEPIQDLDMDALFGSDTGSTDGDLFDLENIEEIAKESQQGKQQTLDWDEAIRIGLIKQ